MTRLIAITIMLAVAAIMAAAQPISTPAPAQEWGLVNVACASLRTAPAHSTELETQATIGTPVLLDSIQSGEWRMVTMPDGYRAWMHTSAFTPVSQTEINEWRKSPRIIVVHPYGGVVTTDTVSPAPAAALTDATLGAIFTGRIAPGSRYARVTLPDGRAGYLPANTLCDFRQWSRKPMNTDSIICCAEAMNGVTYLWGGTTPKALDCSGLTQMCYGHSGTLLPRNASAQAKCGEKVDAGIPDTWQRGDLLFFGPDPDTTRITHVGIYIGNNKYVHCSGMVMTSSIDPESPCHLPRKVLAVRRLDSKYNRFENHRWYF